MCFCFRDILLEFCPTVQCDMLLSMRLAPMAQSHFPNQYIEEQQLHPSNHSDLRWHGSGFICIFSLVWRCQPRTNCCCLERCCTTMTTTNEDRFGFIAAAATSNVAATATTTVRSSYSRFSWKLVKAGALWDLSSLVTSTPKPNLDNQAQSSSNF